MLAGDHAGGAALFVRELAAHGRERVHGMPLGGPVELGELVALLLVGLPAQRPGDAHHVGPAPRPATAHAVVQLVGTAQLLERGRVALGQLRIRAALGRLTAHERNLLVNDAHTEVSHRLCRGLDLKHAVEALAIGADGQARCGARLGRGALGELIDDGAQDLRAIVAEAADVAPEQILGHDLFLYLRGRGSILGAAGELIGAPKLDDLACAFALTEGFLQSGPSGAIPVLAVFDNEEVGSETKQGAASNFLRDTLRRLTLALGKTEEDYLRWCAGSFLVSADNAHAQHPNHPEFADVQNTPYLNGGVVVKFNANQRYATDAVSAAAFRLLCRETGEQTQTYANRSDLPGGSTLGSISDTRVAVPTVDIGLAQLAMHSAYETMGARDLDSLVRVMTAYFGRTPRWNAGAMQLV